MAVEGKRGCGFRKAGGLYLVGGGLAAPCDRLPLPIIPCSICGEEPRFHRAVSKINPLRLWGQHPPDDCQDRPHDPICYPTEKAFLMWVGKEYTPQSFMAEAREMGVSKRISQVPKGLVVGQDWVFLAYLKLIPQEGQPLTLDGDGRGYKPGIFYAFKPTAIEKILTESQATFEERAALEKQGIIPVIVPDDDPDHNPRAKGKQSSLTSA